MSDSEAYFIIPFIAYAGTLFFLYEILPLLKEVWYGWNSWTSDWDCVHKEMEGRSHKTSQR
jgi:hypothetical protein